MNKKNKNKTRDEDDNGFAEWGGYMAAKKSKLLEQYTEVANNSNKKLSDIFKDIAIFVNGYTNPTADELKVLMITHGGTYHHYEMPNTTHILASNLPNVKIKQLGNVPICKANWISDSIKEGKLLDYRKYLLYTNQNRKQPILDFSVVPKQATEHQQVQSHSRTLTAADPRFLSEFYSNSRLHLISTLGAEFKRLVSQLREKSNGKFPGREKLKSLERGGFISTESTVVMHIDMDCFFVSVGLRQRPELRGQPIAVTHAKGSQNPNARSETDLEQENAAMKKYFPHEDFNKIDPHASMAEIASCSYEARKCGVRNGMFLGTALKLCPNLKPIPYDFQGYREVSSILYNTIAAYTLDIEAVSCDEMYVDIGSVLRENEIGVESWATHIREEIMEKTGCPCSTGFGANRLQARLATKKAKPEGQFHLKEHQVEEYMAELPLSDLPGVGHATVAKLRALGLNTCGEVQIMPLSTLQAELGQKAGEVLSEQARGIDRKPLNFQHERKSVSADVNYGIRFKDKIEALNFLNSLSLEVFSRLQDVEMRARCLTLKLLVRAPEAPQEPPKFLGCGVCNVINRSTTTGNLLTDASSIYREAKSLYERANVPPNELRGVGIQLTKLEKAPLMNAGLSRFLCVNTEPPRPETTENVISKSKTVPESPPKLSNKRGRPKGATGSNRNLQNCTKSKSNLNKYFKLHRGKNGLQQEEVDIKKGASKIDLNVLNELPEDLRKEILQEYGFGTSESANRDDPPLETQGKVAEWKSEFGRFNREELKGALMSWFDSGDEPRDFDVSMIASYFKELAIGRKIEELKVLINFLYRHLTKKEHGNWHKAFSDIINVMQEGMVTRYGNTLLVHQSFTCCTSTTPTTTIVKE